ncbi:hypothetical protein CRE_21804 [Caenorhabditis remanei]|uniref:Ubiquitin-like protease family profile domain-containing protein n=1 Tax=Caenorhabditis remanei TaxID=31234 RepID=E3MEK2_CAERE|nr:hypothetical protein CRE_21804 [Caenorhabditis remanei]
MSLSTIQLEKFLRSCRITRESFCGVFPSDHHPVITRLPCSFIWNTAPSSDSGEHWVALWIDDRNFAHFMDSSGSEPQKGFLDFFSKNCGKWKKTFGKPVQGILSNVCGYYCIHFLIRKAMKQSNKRIRHPFTTNLGKNDDFVVKWVKTHLKTCEKRNEHERIYDGDEMSIREKS